MEEKELGNTPSRFPRSRNWESSENWWSTPQAFKEKYGKLLPLLNTNMVDGILPTLVQFYDPTYHCFTFPDYQLMPTLEEYSRLTGIPVYAQDPYSGLEKNPDDIIIAATTPLNVVDIRTHMVSR